MKRRMVTNREYWGMSSRNLEMQKDQIQMERKPVRPERKCEWILRSETAAWGHGSLRNGIWEGTLRREGAKKATRNGDQDTKRDRVPVFPKAGDPVVIIGSIYREDETPIQGYICHAK